MSSAYYGAGTGPINMDDVVCTGYEANLTQCVFTSNDNCDHSNDAGVRLVHVVNVIYVGLLTHHRTYMYM